MGKAEADAANEIYNAAQAEMKTKLEAMQGEIEAVRSESKAIGILEKIEHDMAYNQVIKYAMLYRIKKEKEYKKGGMTWAEFCTAIGEERRNLDNILSDLRPIYDNYSDRLSGLLGLPINKIRYLGREVSAENATLKENELVIDGQAIPLSPDRKDDIEAALDALRESTQRALELKDKEISSMKRVHEHLHNTIDKHERTISKFETQTVKGKLKPEEQNALKILEQIRVTFEGLVSKLDTADIEVANFWSVSGQVKAQLSGLLTYMLNSCDALRDTAETSLGISVFDEWEQPTASNEAEVI